MPKTSAPQLIRTTSLRKPRWSSYDPPDIISGQPDEMVVPSRRWRRLLSYPKPGWADGYDPSGHFFSKRDWHYIVGKVQGFRKALKVEEHQERDFRYRPAIPWEENPAYWDSFDHDVD